MRRWQCSGDLVIVIRHALRAAAGREGDRVSGRLSISLPETAELAKADGQPRTRDGVRVSFPIEEWWESPGNADEAST